MLKSRKGFMLAEVVVVSVVVATVLVVLFTGLNRVASGYEKRNQYFDIDTAYISSGVNEALIRSGSINDMIKNGVVRDISNDSDVTSYVNSSSRGGIVKAYFSLYNKSSIDSLKNLNSNKTFASYIEYISGTLEGDGYYNYGDNFTYVIITEFCDNEDDCSYYGLRVK